MTKQNHKNNFAIGSDNPEKKTKPIGRGKKILRRGLIAFGCFAVFIGGYYLYMQFGITNFHEVVPNKVFRSAQPSPEQLSGWIKKYGLKTVINLRKDAHKTGWDAEFSAAKLAGAKAINIGMSDRKLPPREIMLAMAEAIENSPKPLLLHCKAGADRAGVASVFAAMSVGGEKYETARDQLTILYLHVNWMDTSIGGVLEQYEKFCEKKSRSTGGWTEFKGWLENDYIPADSK